MKPKSLKKVFAGLLAFMLIVALLPTTVFAAGSTTITKKNKLSAALADSNITEIHIAGNMTVYTGDLNTDKTIVIDSDCTLTVSSASDFQTGNLIISDGATLKVVATSVSWPAHVYGTVENNGTILMTKETDNGGSIYWHAKTTGTGICSTETCNKTVCIDYGAIPSEMFTAESTNYKINIIKDTSKNATFTMNEADLIPGNAITATIDNLVDGINLDEVFKFQWKGNSSTLSSESTCQIPLNMSGKKITVTASIKSGSPYVMLDSNSNIKTSISQWSGTVRTVTNTTLYVDMMNGNNNNLGTEDQPLKTLYKAIDNIEAGGTIYLIGDYDATTDGEYVYSFLENITIKGSGTEKSTLTTWKETYIGDGVTVTFDNIDFGDCSDLFAKYPYSTGTGSLIFQNVSGGNISVSDLDSVTLKNSSLGSQNLQTNTLELDESTLTGKFSCNDFVAKGNAALVLNGTGSIAKSSTVEQPVTVTPSSLANGTLVIEVPEESPEWADDFVLNDTENGKFTLKCRTSTYGDPCLIVTEKLVAGGPLHIAFAPECSGDVVDKEPGKTYIDVPNEFYAAVTSAVWSGYSDIDGKTWQAGDIPELTVVMRTDISGTNKESYYFAEDFDPSQFIIYDWQDLDQFAENFYKDEYQIHGVTAVVKTGQGVSDDGKMFTFTLQFPTVTHNLQKVDYKAPTCTEDGNIEYWSCKNCGKYFSDENGTNEITLEDTILPATGCNGSSTYPPIIADTIHGNVTTSPTYPYFGQTVIIRPNPDEGYEVDEVIVTDSQGNDLQVKDNGDGTFSFRQPGNRVTITVTFRCTGSELCSSRHLTDVLLKVWYHEAVDYVVEHSIMTGTSGTTFEPDATLSRAMVAQILYNLEGQPAVVGERTFTDSGNHWAAKAITWAQQTGVVSGYEDDTFRPNQAVTREELAQMLYNYAKYKGYDLTAKGDLTAFSDGSKVSSWAETAMAWANGNKLINGFEDKTLRPGGDSTRAQAASILMNFDLNLVEE